MLGVSIPIGTERYQELKSISNELGLGLKNTVEYLITHYLNTRKPQENSIQTSGIVHIDSKMNNFEEGMQERPNPRTISRYDAPSQIPPYLEARIYPHLNTNKSEVQTSKLVHISDEDLQNHIGSLSKILGELSEIESKIRKQLPNLQVSGNEDFRPGY